MTSAAPTYGRREKRGEEKVEGGALSEEDEEIGE